MSEEWFDQGMVESLMKRSLLVKGILRDWDCQAERMNNLNTYLRSEALEGMSGKGNSIDFSLETLLKYC